MKVLFIVKKQRFGYSGGGMSSGLYNSAKFVVDMLGEQLSVRAKVVVVTDNNDIDREVHHFRPNIVIIEALWVEPNKFHALTRLHPQVKWIVRNHSALPFLAHEGIAMGWIFRYMRAGHVQVGCNDSRTRRELEMLAEASGLETDVKFLPNYYPREFHPRTHDPYEHRRLRIGCFGAIRPLKNQLIQAVAAIDYAERVQCILDFHINVARVECEGEPILRNLRDLFKNLPRHHLVEHAWLPRPEFIELVRTMDLGLQCAYSETFNIVAADFVMNDVPVVVSSEVKWVLPRFWADPNDSSDISNKIRHALHHPNSHGNRDSLRFIDACSVRAWSAFLSRHE